jgi:parallel beta-helix repeat protein
LNKRNIIVGIAVFFSVLLLGIVIYSNEGSQNSLPNPSNTPTPTWPSFPNSKTIEVPEDYSTISLAINASNAGDTILVKEGTYVESVTVDKSLTIRGENKEKTIVDGNNMGPTFLIKSDYVKITGFKIRNVENPPPVSDSRARLAGVHLLDAHGCDISENVAVNCGKGVWVYGGSGNTVSNNILSGNNYGILIQSSTDNSVTRNNASNGWGGIWLDSSSGNKLRNNNMLNNARSFGVSGGELYQFVNDIDLTNMVNDKKVYYLLDKESLTIDPDSFPDLGALVLVNCRDVTVQNLAVQNNHIGVHVVGAANSTVTHNAVGSNTVGIWLEFSSDCVISKNDVKNNTDCGVRVERSNDIFVLENNVEQNEFESRIIMMQNSSNSTIAENTLGTEGLPVAIYLESSNYINITSNYQSGPGTIYGITLKSSSNNLLQSNTFTNCVPGVWLREGSNYNRIIENSFSTERGSMGIALSESYFNNLSENIIYNFHTGLELSNAENNVIARNIVTSKDIAVKLFKFNNNTFEGNQFYGATDIWDSGKDMGYPSTNIWK